MKVKFMVALAGLLVVIAGPSTAADDGSDVMPLSLQAKESEAKETLSEPHFGYTGPLGSFEVAVREPSGREPIGLFVVHKHPDPHQLALGQTKLKYLGTKRLGEIDGYVCQTDWSGKVYPSKVFFSAHKVYLGAGITEYIAADYREDTGWVWKTFPMRRMELVSMESAGSAFSK
jgi:hypothetical protein